MSKHKNFMMQAEVIAMNSKDTSTKVGALIVDNDNRIVSSGYNGFVAGCDESYMSLERPAKYLYTIHAEMNALLFARRDVKGFTLYTTAGPCVNCLKHILQSGIRKIYYKDPGIVRDRGTVEEKAGIFNLLLATRASVTNIDTGASYVDEIN